VREPVDDAHEKAEHDTGAADGSLRREREEESHRAEDDAADRHREPTMEIDYAAAMAVEVRLESREPRAQLGQCHRGNSSVVTRVVAGTECRVDVVDIEVDLLLFRIRIFPVDVNRSVREPERDQPL